MYFPNTLPSFAKMLIGFHDIYRRMCKNIYPCLTDALEDFVMPNSKCLVEINGKVLTIKMFWQDGDVKSCARVIIREQQKD